jgi:hypothetical protein
MRPCPAASCGRVWFGTDEIIGNVRASHDAASCVCSFTRVSCEVEVATPRFVVDTLLTHGAANTIRIPLQVSNISAAPKLDLPITTS